MRFIATIISENIRCGTCDIDVRHAVIEAMSQEAAVGVAYIAANRLLKGKITCKVTALDSLSVIVKPEDARLS